jgi:levanase
MKRKRGPLRAVVVAGIVAGALAFSSIVPAVAAASADPVHPEATQLYRPQIHFSPTENWMNDPNGLVYYKGVYHLFYQYNPLGNTWGNMSWGHATSTDLVHWTQQPLAIPNDDTEDIFSGSVVVDKDNTSGLGTADNPPLVAVFTSAYKSGANNGLQAQSLAYSLDAGQTWTKYSGNPVLNRNSANFRDPKVFWYSGSAGSYWVMTAVEAAQHQVVLYKSSDLKNWTYLSDFGPANATGGVWETPDLFPLDLDGDPNKVKWVLTVGINPGAVSGGSGGQYFVGDFDGQTFTADDVVDDSALPQGTTFAGFDGSDFDGWDVTGTAFGSSPATGAVDGQQTVTGFDGAGFADSFHGQDGTTGTLTSPAFTIDQSYINFLVGGGNHPHVDGTQAGNDAPADSELLFDGFEYPDGESVADHGWSLTGDFVASLNPSTGGGTGYLGQKELSTFQGGANGDANQGTMTSPTFTIDKRYLSMLVSGGNRTADSGQTLQAELLVDGNVVETAAGKNDGDLNWQSWDLSAYQGQQAQLRLDDQATGGWGSLAIDNVVLADTSALPHGTETAVDLMVDGKVVRTTTGADAENLDWASWNVSDLAGKQATIQIVDDNSSGWGHINADQFMFSDTAQAPRLQNYNWVDYGRDFYAANSFNDAPNGERVMLGWMNNWDYGGDIPTSPWRSAMSLPRDVLLKTVDGQPRLVQQPVDEVKTLAADEQTYEAAPSSIVSGMTELPAAASAEVARVDATISQGTAKQFGLVVRRSTDGSEGTPIVYDTTTGDVTVDRRDSGDVDFNASFPSVESAPVALDGGKLHLEIYLDKSSVELFAQGGVRTITDQIFPQDSSIGLALYAAGGTAHLDSLKVTPLQDAMWGTAQTITFDPIGTHTYGDPDFAITGSASSGLPVSYAAAGACSVGNGVVHLAGAGVCSITASQPGDDSYNPAPSVTQTFAVAKASQTIGLAGLTGHRRVGAVMKATAWSTSGLAVSLTAHGACVIKAKGVRLKKVGTCKSRATQAGDGDQAAASPVTVSFKVHHKKHHHKKHHHKKTEYPD